MEISDLERMAQAAMRGAKNDTTLARSKFSHHMRNNAEAILLMSEEGTRIWIAQAWFDEYLKNRSPQGEGAATTSMSSRTSRATPPPTSSPTARPQSAADITSARKGAQILTRTVFDSFKVRDGRPIGDVRWNELERLRSANTQEASVIRQIQRSAVPADPETLVRDIVKTRDLERMIQRAAEMADAA